MSEDESYYVPAYLHYLKTWAKDARKAQKARDPDNPKKSKPLKIKFLYVTYFGGHGFLDTTGSTP